MFLDAADHEISPSSEPMEGDHGKQSSTWME